MEMRNSLSASAVAISQANGPKSIPANGSNQNIEPSILVLITVQSKDFNPAGYDVCPIELQTAEHCKISNALDLSPVSLA